MKIKLIVVNWYFTNDGEEFQSFLVGNNEVTNITEHQPQGEGDKWYYDVHYKNGTITRYFNVNQVEFVKV